MKEKVLKLQQDYYQLQLRQQQHESPEAESMDEGCRQNEVLFSAEPGNGDQSTMLELKLDSLQ